MGETENWARTVRFSPRKTVAIDAPAPGASALAELDRRVTQVQAAVRDALNAGRRVRAVGSLWSFSDVVRADDTMIATEGLRAVIDVTRDASGAPLAGALRAALDGSAKGEYAFVEAGAKLHPLFGALKKRGLAFRTTGSSSGQAVAGVVSTSTHGADFDRAPIADSVRALVLVNAEGERLWLEPEAPRLTRDDAPEQLLPGVRVVRDDARFEAALASVGTAGVICALVLEVVPLYGLSEKTTWSTWSQVRLMLSEAAPVGASAFGDTPPGAAHPAPTAGPSVYGFLEAIVNPYRTSDDYGPSGAADRSVLLCTRVEAPRDPGSDWTRDTPDLLDGLGALIDVLSGSQKECRERVDRLVSSGRGDSGGFHPAPDVFDFGETRASRVWSVEAVARTKDDAHLAFLDAVLAAFDRVFAAGHRLAGFLSLRFTRGTRASLGMQNGPTGPSGRYCHVELSALQHPRHLNGWDPTRLAAGSERFVRAFWNEARARAADGTVCLHWGQDLPEPLEAWRPRPVRFERLAAHRAAIAALGGRHRYAFASEIDLRAGIAPPPAGWTLVSTGLPTDRSAAPYDCAAVAASRPVFLRDDRAPRDALYAAQGDGFVGWIPWTGRPARWKLARTPQERVAADEAIAGALSVAVNDDGRPELFARAHDGRVYHRWRESAVLGHPARWSGWTPLSPGPAFASDPAAARAGDGRLVVVAVDASGRVLARHQRTIAGWSRWAEVAPLPGSHRAVGRPALVRRADGTLLLAVRDRTGAVWVTHQTGPKAAADWRALAPTSLTAGGDPDAAVGPRGVLVVAPRPAGGLGALLVDGTGRPGPATTTFGTIPLRAGTRVRAVALARRFAVAFTEPEGQIVPFAHSGTAWEHAGAPVAAASVSTPELVPVGASRVRVLTRLTHDLIQTRTIAL
ncbi:MAG TPA: FAD-binding protein [Sandaracinaceae bacterium LLY-WYZ-13_1]|nr:FAD-binding protein [Sandaracinaceae bacterium LLY-WYZ-13_1]